MENIPVDKESLVKYKEYLEQHKSPINNKIWNTITSFLEQQYDCDKSVYNRLYKKDKVSDLNQFIELNGIIVYVSSIFEYVKFDGGNNEYVDFTVQLNLNMVENDGNYQIIFNDSPRKFMFDISDDVTDQDLIDICTYTELALSKTYEFTFTSDNMYITHDKIEKKYHVIINDKRLVSYTEQLLFVEYVRSYINTSNKYLINKINNTIMNVTQMKKYQYIKHFVSDNMITIEKSKLVRKKYLQCFNILNAVEYYNTLYKDGSYNILIEENKPDIKQITISYIEKTPPTKRDSIKLYLSNYINYVINTYPSTKPYGKQKMATLLTDLGYTRGKNNTFTYWYLKPK